MTDSTSFANMLRTTAGRGKQRQAALLLRSVSEPDREWLLNSLPEADRDILRGLLVELDQLGLPVDSDVIQAAVRGAGTVARQVVAEPTFSEIDERLLIADPALVAQVLINEPVQLVARLLALHDWPWAPGFIATFGPYRRRQLESRRSIAPLSRARNRLDAALLLQFAASLAAVSPDSVDDRSTKYPPLAPAVPRWWKRGLVRRSVSSPAEMRS